MIYCKVTNQLGSVKAEKAEKTLQLSKSNHFNKSHFKSRSKNNSGFNFNTQVQKFTPHCRFCVADSHNSVDCTIYATYQQRLGKCGELKLCTQYTSPKHASDPFFFAASKTGPGGLFKVCKYCKSDKHVAGLCNNKNPHPQL